MSDLYRLIYTSRNLLGGGEAEQAAAVDGILTASRLNNARVGVTGALLFNAGFFAQILEGSRAAVELTFERIQRDPRHSDVSVLHCEPVAARGFPNWSMAFVGHAPHGQALWGDFAQQTGFDLANIEADRLFATLLTIVEREENEASLAPSPAPRGPGLDVERLRDALWDAPSGAPRSAPQKRRSGAEPGATAHQPTRGPLQPQPPVQPPAPPPGEAGVLRAALDEERARTTALRRELDDARVALAAARAEAEAAQRLREVWAERARAMAEILAREPGFAGAEKAPQEANRPTLVRSFG